MTTDKRERAIAKYLCKQFICGSGACEECVPGKAAFEDAKHIIALSALKSDDKLVEMVNDLCDTVRKCPIETEWHRPLSRLLAWQDDHRALIADQHERGD